MAHYLSAATTLKQFQFYVIVFHILIRIKANNVQIFVKIAVSLGEHEPKSGGVYEIR
jgi:hypothetical protein